MWESYKRGFKIFLQLEKSLSNNSVEAYLRDLDKLTDYLQLSETSKNPQEIEASDLQNFLQWINELELSSTSQTRIVSGIRAFYKYCLLEDIVKKDPSQLIEAPKTKRSLPDVLSPEEIDAIICQIDLSKPEGERNKAILEILYSCGLRVSEVVALRISQLHLDVGYIRVIGKGDKERLVPVGGEATKYLNIYLNHSRNKITAVPGNEDIVFLNRRGKKLTRVMVFHIIKELTAGAGIQKTVSPHTFRHSFATHLIEGGANLRAVQEMLGHENITTTEIYTHLDRDFLRKTLEKYHPSFNKGK